MIKKILLIGVFVFSLTLTAQAANPFDIQFPIAELGGCTSMDECKTYCDDSANAGQCIKWAEDNGFAPEQPVEPDHQDVKGPGGCDSRESCDNFCHNPENNQICLNFAVSEGFMTQAEADRIMDLHRRQEEFHKRARDRAPDRPRIDDHHEDEPEIDEAKVLELLKETDGPGGCSTFDQCDEYCSNDDHGDECFAFAVRHGLIGQEDAEKFKRMMELEGPGGCRGEECRDFCDAPGHERECLEFAHDNGFIPEEEYQEVKKFVDILEIGGPGGCKDKRTCDNFCSNPSNQEECFQFGKQHGLISPEELELIEEMESFEREMRAREEEQIRRGEEFRRDEFRNQFENFRPDEGFEDFGEFGDGEFRGDFEDYRNTKEFEEFGEEYFRVDPSFESDEFRPQADSQGEFQEFRNFEASDDGGFPSPSTDERFRNEFNDGVDKEFDGQYNDGFDRQFEDQGGFQYDQDSTSGHQPSTDFVVPEIHDFPDVQQFEIPNNVEEFDSRNFPAPTDYVEPEPLPPAFEGQTDLGDLSGSVFEPFLKLLTR